MDRFQGKSRGKTGYNGCAIILKSRFLQNHPGSCFDDFNGGGMHQLVAILRMQAFELSAVLVAWGGPPNCGRSCMFL